MINVYRATTTYRNIWAIYLLWLNYWSIRSVFILRLFEPYSFNLNKTSYSKLPFHSSVYMYIYGSVIHYINFKQLPGLTDCTRPFTLIHSSYTSNVTVLIDIHLCEFFLCSISAFHRREMWTFQAVILTLLFRVSAYSGHDWSDAIRALYLWQAV